MRRSSWMSNLEMAVADGDIQSAMEYLDAPFFDLANESLSHYTTTALKKAMRVGAKSMVQLLYERHAIDFDEEPMVHLLASFNTVYAPRRKQKELFDYLISLEEVRDKIEHASSLQSLTGYPTAHMDKEKRDFFVELLCGGSERSDSIVTKLARLTTEEFQTAGRKEDEEEDEGEEKKHEQSLKKARKSPERSNSKRNRESKEEEEEENTVRIFFQHESDDDGDDANNHDDDDDGFFFVQHRNESDMAT
jgi:hypothetical protein